MVNKYTDEEYHIWAKIQGDDEHNRCEHCKHLAKYHVPTHPKGFLFSRTMHCEECEKRKDNFSCRGMMVSGSYYTTAFSILRDDMLDKYYHKEFEKEARVNTNGPVFFVNGELGCHPSVIERTIEYDIMDHNEILCILWRKNSV